MKKIIPIVVSIIFLSCIGKHSETSSVVHKDPVNFSYSELQEIPFHRVKIRDDFWSRRIKMMADTTLPLVWELAKEQGRIENFKIVAGESDAQYNLRNSPDAPLYKLIEAAAYTFTEYDNKELEAAMDSLISLAARIQQPDGYLHTQFMLDVDGSHAPRNKGAVNNFGFGKGQQWKSVYTAWPKGYSQLFTAGHMFEAAVAYYRATGKTELLKASLKLADLLVRKFDSIEFVKQYADHPQVEIGLMKLYEVTGDEKYARTANNISRHVKFARPPDLHLDENLLPLHEQRNAFGHAVRTAYLYSGATDVVRAIGATDLQSSLLDLWESVAGRKMYIHGGTGNGSAAEQHGLDFDLPIYPTYSEGCANVAQGQWNHRLNLLTGNANFANIVELEMYNAALAGMSWNGKEFFYSNKINVELEDRKGKFGGVRETYFFCCPSKLPGFISGVSRWMYAKDSQGIYINQYIASDLETSLNNEALRFTMDTKYPYDGKMVFTVTEGNKQRYDINFRIPGWVRGNSIFEGGLYAFKNQDSLNYTVRVNGNAVEKPNVVKGYLRLSGEWKVGDTVSLEFHMPVRRVYTKESNKYNAGRVALMRGPILYALEGVDNDFDISQFVLPADNRVTAEFDPDLFNGTVVLVGRGCVDGKEVGFKAIPYHLWQNRGVGKMSLLLIESPDELYEQTKTLKTKINTNG